MLLMTYARLNNSETDAGYGQKFLLFYNRGGSVFEEHYPGHWPIHSLTIEVQNVSFMLARILVLII